MIEEHTNTDAAGIYKKNNNFIMEYNHDETQRVRFKPINARESKAAMEQLILSFYEARQDSEIASLLPIPCFIVDFLCIPPLMMEMGVFHDCSQYYYCTVLDMILYDTFVPLFQYQSRISLKKCQISVLKQLNLF